jgi:hypothetical protein
MKAASIWALGINRTQAALSIQKLAVAIGTTSHGENAVFVVKAVNQFGFLQALGNAAWVFVLSLKRVHQPQPNQVGQTHL